MTQTALITLGRLPKALDIAEALSKAGWRVIIAEPSKNHLCKLSKYVSKSFAVTAPNTNQASYLQDLQDIIKREKVSLVVPVSEEALHATLIGENLSESVELFSVSQARLLALHDKFQFNQIASSLGLSVPKTYLLGTDDAQNLSHQIDYILKPACTCSGQGFSMHHKNEPLTNAPQEQKMIIQEQMKGALKSTFSIAHEGRVIGTVVYKAAILSGSVAVAFERLDDEVQIEEWISKFVKETNHTGFISFDMMENEEGVPHAIECNPRATSGIHFIERDDLAKAITNPATQHGLNFRPHRFMQQFFPCLTEVQMSFFKRSGFLKKAKIMIKAKEVNFSISDPLPLLLMPIMSWSILSRSIFKGETFGEASTFDIAWFDEAK